MTDRDSYLAGFAQAKEMAAQWHEDEIASLKNIDMRIGLTPYGKDKLGWHAYARDELRALAPPELWSKDAPEPLAKGEK